MLKGYTISRISAAVCKNGLRLAFSLTLINLLFVNAVQSQSLQSTPTNLQSVASVGDLVWMDKNKNGLQEPNEPGMSNIMVILYDSLMNNLASVYTDAKGHYLFEGVKIPLASSKSFIIGFYNIPPNHSYTGLTADGEKLDNNSKTDPITGRTKSFRLTAGTLRTDIDAGIVDAPGVVLPLTIDQFNGFYDNGVIQLKWKTFTEINVDHFDIERSTDGTNFRQIGRVYASGGEVTNNTYSYIDISAERGTNFYRLALIDNEGNYTYSKAITLTVDIKGITVSVVYPNPFSKRVQVKLDCLKAEQITIRVLDNAGNVVRSQINNLQKGENNIVVQNVAELPGGIYFLEVIGDHRSMKTKLMKE